MDEYDYEHIYKLSDGTSLRVEMCPPCGWLYTLYGNFGMAIDGGFVYDECYTMNNHQAAKQALELLDIDVELC